MSPGQVSGGSMPQGSFYGADTYGGLEVMACYAECPPIAFEITGPTWYNLVAGEDGWFPWDAIRGQQPYQWSLHGTSAVEFVDHEMGGRFVRSTQPGLYEDVTVRATDAEGEIAELVVTISVEPPPVLTVTGPDEVEIEVGNDSFYLPWDAADGVWPFEWEITGLM